jgi:hypothetical protein
VAFVERAEGAHVAFGDGEKQRLVARAAVHVLTVASPGQKSFTRGGEFPPGLPRPRDRTQPGQSRGRRTANGPRVLIYRYLTWREGRERLARRRCLARRHSRNPGACIPRDLNPHVSEGGTGQVIWASRPSPRRRRRKLRDTGVREHLQLVPGISQRYVRCGPGNWQQAGIIQMVYAGFGFPLSAYRDGQLVGHTGKSKVADLRRPPGFQEARYRQPNRGKPREKPTAPMPGCPTKGSKNNTQATARFTGGWMQDSIYPAASTRALRTAHSYRV